MRRSLWLMAGVSLRKVFYLLFAISLASLSGCNEEGDEQEPPRVTYVSWGISELMEGDTIPGAAIITVGFSKSMEWVNINVSGAKGTTHFTRYFARNQAEWVPEPHWPTGPTPYDMLVQPGWPCYSPIPEGIHTLMITGVDKYGQELEGFKPINFSVIPLECDPPEICGNECDPRDNANDVDPQQYKEKLVIVFSKRMAEVKVFYTEPEFPYTAELNTEARKLIILFAHEYTIPGGTAFRIELVGSDAAGYFFGSWPEPEKYSFTAKVE